MKKSATIDQARQLISDRQFPQALKVCEALIRGKTEDPEVFVLAAACQLCVGCMEKDAKKRERIRKAVQQALTCSDDAARVQKTEQRLLSALDRWRTEQMTAVLSRQKEKISLPELKNYYDLILRYDNLPEMIRSEAASALAALGSCEAVEQELEAGKLRRTELAQQEFEIACSAFGEAKMTIRFHAAGTASQVSATLRAVIEMVTVAQVLAQRSAGDGDDAVRCQRMKKEAEILHFGLTAMLHPDGKAMSLYSSGREEMTARLQECWAAIRELDPDYEAPALPGDAVR